MKPTPRIYLLCGKTGSGKTTYARQREADGAVRFSLDEWMIRFYGHHMSREEFQTRTRICEETIFELASALAARQLDVVIDHGLWTKESRTWARSRLASATADVVLVHFTASDVELMRRIEARNAVLPAGTFLITEDMFHTFSKHFESPSMDEVDITVDAESSFAERRNDGQP
jgi:predicted kinase